MNISYNWLKDLIVLDLTVEETAAALTRVGLAVEGIERHGDDTVFDVDITSNRPDCLSHLGIARELGAALGESLDVFEPEPEIPMPPVLAHDIVRIDDPKRCYRFTARIIRGVKVGPSPKWLVDRLEAVGERSINNVADITNYVMLELGQPMHSFDLDKLAGGRIIVRSARAGEKMVTLDDVERSFDESMLLVCDAEKPAAIGGVIGGLESAITDSTVNVLLEVAYFRPDSVRTLARKLGVSTEASHRFERGVDIDNIVRASQRGANLICELAGGEKGEFIDIYPTPIHRTEIECGDVSNAVARLTGMEVSESKAVSILDALGIESEDRNGLRVFCSPSWRYDISIEEDLVEEVARHTGYENIRQLLPPASGAGEFQAAEPQKAAVRNCLIDMGYSEALSYSFIDTDWDGVFQPVPKLDGSDRAHPVTLRDSVIENAVRMRQTALPGLLDAVKLNNNHQVRDVRLFEIGKAFISEEPGELPTERELLCIVGSGGDLHADRVEPERTLDFFDLKGALEGAFEAAGVEAAEFEAADLLHLRSGQSASILIAGNKVGALGRLSEEIAQKYKFRQPVFVGELDLTAVLAANRRTSSYTPIAKFPSVRRDVTFEVGRTPAVAAILRSARTSGEPLIEHVGLVTVFEGGSLSPGHRAVTIRVEYRSPERTLSEEDVEYSHSRLLARLDSELGLRPRK
ncbi:MAG TPA: phenylalanine--tRNA ligase subunit beta [Pyrinomonadaceae bacterium]|nr:phenylalanine--tRNA ligase subunit beta [Pyrinomonadaceae bacterium]